VVSRTNSRRFRRGLPRLHWQRGLTQTQLGESIGIYQQHVVSYEVGRRRVALALLPSIRCITKQNLDRQELGIFLQPLQQFANAISMTNP